MSYQNISYSLSQVDVDAVKTAITTINTKLFFMVTLDPQEKRSLFKLGEKSVDFVNDASTAVTNFPTILPPSFDKVEFGKDSVLFKQLAELKTLVDSLSEKINNTYIAVGSEAMTASLEVYSYVQTAKDRTPGLQTLADEMKKRFKGQGKKAKGGSDQNP
jgi:hypothetical protein